MRLFRIIKDFLLATDDSAKLSHTVIGNYICATTLWSGSEYRFAKKSTVFFFAFLDAAVDSTNLSNKLVYYQLYFLCSPIIST